MNAIGLGGWEAADVLLKAILYAVTFAGAGGVFFILLCGARVSVADRRRLGSLIGAALLIACVLSGLRIAVLAGSLSGHAAGMVDSVFIDMILDSDERRATLVRVAGLVLAAAALSRAPVAMLPATLGAVLAITSFSWVGHAHAVAAPTADTLLEAIHLLCVAFWLGALLPLWIIATHDTQGARIAAAADRFGRAAVIVVAVLIAAGAALLWMMLGGSLAGWGSDYGRLLLVKLAWVAALLALASYNKLHLTPRLRSGDREAARALRRSIGAEVFVAGAILLTTAVLTTLTGPPALE